MPFKVKVTDAEGNVVDGTLADADIPQELLTQEIADDQFGVKFAPRARSLKKSHRAELLADPEFMKESLASQDVDIDALKAAAAAGGDMNAEKVGELRKGWDNEFLLPEQALNKTLKGKLGTLRGAGLRSAIVEAARRVGVKESFLRPPTKGADPMIVASFAGRFRYDEDSSEWLEKDGDDYHFSSDPAKYGTPHRGVDESFDVFAKGLDKEGKEMYLAKQRQTGPGFDGVPRAAGSIDVTLTESQAMNAQTYQAAEKQAAELGGRVVVTAADE